MANKTWVVIRLGKWKHKATGMFLYDRVYRHGDKWTPFCIKKFRYVGGIGCYIDEVLAIHEQIGYDKGFADGYAEALDKQNGQVRHGRWIFNPKDAIEMVFTLPKCSECGAESPNGGNYCPNCGAKMDGGADDAAD